jgi:hypothetical protein
LPLQTNIKPAGSKSRARRIFKGLAANLWDFLQAKEDRVQERHYRREIDYQSVD